VNRVAVSNGGVVDRTVGEVRLESLAGLDEG
jgi:hypothetical protein